MRFIKKAIKWTLIIFVGLSVLSFLFGKGSPKQPAKNETSKVTTSPTAQVKQKTQEEIAVEKAREEERLNTLATKYCEVRKDSSRYFPIPEVKVGEDGKREYKQNDDLKKQGRNLTQADCKNIVDYMQDLAIKYPLVASFDIEAVAEMKHWIGMNSVELSQSIGYPNKINTTKTAAGENQQWVYRYSVSNTDYYYVDGETLKVTAYQDN